MKRSIQSDDCYGCSNGGNDEDSQNSWCYRRIPKGAGLTLIGIAIAIRILAGALKKLEGMDMDSMG